MEEKRKERRDTDGEGEGTQVERGRGHRWRGGGDTGGEGEGTQVERGHRWRGGGDTGGEGTQVERGRGHRWRGDTGGEGTQVERGRGHRWRGDTGGEGEGTQVERGRGYRWRGGGEGTQVERGVAKEGLRGGEKGDGKATLTLSMTASDNMIDRIPMAPKPTDAANPGRPMPQNIDTEKYLERERDVSTRRGGRKMCRGGRIEGREEELLTQYSSDHQGVPGKAKDSQSPTFTRNHDDTTRKGCCIIYLCRIFHCSMYFKVSTKGSFFELTAD